ncbi:MAG: glycosyltransferase [Streptosporangiaceae bacterium]
MPVALAAGWLAWLRWTHPLYLSPVNVVWLAITGLVVLQIAVSWLQRPYQVTERQRRALDRLRVAVVIPCYNEDPAILDRTLYAIARQTRLPEQVIVTDDGSAVEYGEVRAWWQLQMPGQFIWIRQDNAGKRHAQAAGFRAAWAADIYVTIDSDSALVGNAIEEGLKPFARRKVTSVSCMESALNFSRNMLTRMVAARSLAFQLYVTSAQSVASGNVLINPGAFSIYRGWLIRQVLPAYLGETFLGIPVNLGDDTALTTFSVCLGAAVQQPTAFAMTAYPETVSHHLRQWTRWMRGSTVRVLWNLRYLPVLSWGWMFSFYLIWSYLASVALTIVIPLTWPASRPLLLVGGLAMLAWPWLIAVRLATVKRSDMRTRDTLLGLALLPVSSLWFLLVLRQMRLHGIATCEKQGWVTRGTVEVRLRPGETERAGDRVAA